MVSGLYSSNFIAAGATVREALGAINRLAGVPRTLFAIDAEGRLAGTLTDGDIRRALIGGVSTDAAVEEVMYRKYTALRPGSDPFEAVREAKGRGVELVPELDADGRVVHVHDLTRMHDYLPIDAVLMAGGRGERLRPLTLQTPKPLLDVGGRPIIDYNVENLKRNGVERFYVTVNYLRGQLEEYFAGRRDVEGVCVAEPKPLGTFGSLGLIGDWRHDVVLVMNSDLLTTVDLAGMYAAHKRSGAALTIGSVPYSVRVPFAILDISDDRVQGLKEKPTYNYLANGGVYMVNRDAVETIAENEYLDAPDFIESLIREGRKVGYFPIEGTWIDIGSPEDYRSACRLMTKQ